MHWYTWGSIRVVKIWDRILLVQEVTEWIYNGEEVLYSWFTLGCWWRDDRWYYVRWGWWRGSLVWWSWQKYYVWGETRREWVKSSYAKDHREELEWGYWREEGQDSIW